MLAVSSGAAADPTSLVHLAARAAQCLTSRSRVCSALLSPESARHKLLEPAGCR